MRELTPAEGPWSFQPHPQTLWLFLGQIPLVTSTALALLALQAKCRKQPAWWKPLPLCCVTFSEGRLGTDQGKPGTSPCLFGTCHQLDV